MFLGKSQFWSAFEVDLVTYRKSAVDPRMGRDVFKVGRQSDVSIVDEAESLPRFEDEATAWEEKLFASVLCLTFGLMCSGGGVPGRHLLR